MADPNKIVTSIGLRRVRVAARDSDGTIDVPAGQAVADAYNGLRISGANALSINLPEPNRVPAQGDDRVYYTFQLPPDEGVTGELRTSKSNMLVHALLTGTLIWGSSPIRKVGHASDKLGEEIACVMWGSQQAIDSEPSSVHFGRQVWHTYVLLNALATPRPAPMERATVGEQMYSVVANDSTVDVTGETFSEDTMGFTQCPYIEIVTLGKFGLCAWAGDGANTVFNLPSGEFPLLSGTNPEVWVDGVQQVAGFAVDGTLGTLTFGVAPADGAKIILIYEY